MEITEEMQMHTDFDWYAIDPDNTIVHFASGGGLLPKSVCASKEDLARVAHFCRSLPEFVSNVELNPTLESLVTFKSEQDKARYIQDFVSMSKKGFFSFDKDNPGNFSNKGYHLVAKPVQLLKIETLPEEIAIIIKKTTIKIPVKNIDRLILDDIS